MPHYVRCLKPNENKARHDWDSKSMDNQIKYLALAENVRIRQAGFCYRRSFGQFLSRFNILQYVNDVENAKPPPKVSNNKNEAIRMIKKILNEFVGNESANEWQLGKTMVFIKSPTKIENLEIKREQFYDSFATNIQKYVKIFATSESKAEES